MSLAYCLTERQQDTNENYIYNKNISKLLTVFAQSDVLQLPEGRGIRIPFDGFIQMLIEVQMFNYFREPSFCKFIVMGRFSISYVGPLKPPSNIPTININTLFV